MGAFQKEKMPVTLADMANSEHLAKLQEGIATWNDWRAQPDNRGIRPDLSGADLRKMYLSGAKLELVDLHEANLEAMDLHKARFEGSNLSEANLGQADLTDVNLVGANLHSANLNGANLERSNLQRANLLKAKLIKTNLSRVNLGGANLSGAKLRRANLLQARLDEADLSGADLTKADFFRVKLIGADFTGANLCGTNLNNAKLNHSKWSGVRLNSNTQLERINFSSEHDAMQDGSDTIIFSWKDKWINWYRLRLIGQFPLFGVSWSALALALIMIHGIDLLNDTKFVKIIEYPIPIPERIWWVLWSSFLLVIGSTLYKLKCPHRIQTFSETEWVEKHGQPRQLYVAESLSRGQLLKWLTLIFSLVGGLLALVLIGERLCVIAIEHRHQLFHMLFSF